jgi:integrase
MCDHVTLATVLGAYLRFRSPRKSEREGRADARRAEMWARVLGPDLDPHVVSMAEWEAFIDSRSAGAIDARGRPVCSAGRRPVGPRAVEADCRWLRWVFNWATRWRTESGTYLMRENPVRGYESPAERNPRRPVATQDRYEALRAVSDQVRMQLRRGDWEIRRCYLSELLDIVNGTGRRISAVCRLTYDDLRLGEGPHGALRWPAATDKMGVERTVLVSPGVRRALDRILDERPGAGPAPLFPSPADPLKPVTRHLADKWLRKAERLAGLEAQNGSLWHAYRRKWATERKHHPDVDVAAAGGWKSLQALKTAYQQADPNTMLRVVLEPHELSLGR